MFALVDEADFERVSQLTWCLSRAGRNKLYAKRQGNLYMHRFLLDVPNHLEVDHVDGNGLNNRRSNLRPADTASNRHNMKARQTAISRFKGVGPEDVKWRASIRVRNKIIRIGRFATEEEAAHAWDEAARKYHGEFARLNFPREGEQPALVA